LKGWEFKDHSRKKEKKQEKMGEEGGRYNKDGDWLIHDFVV
jgi:hypothetical protein